MDGGVAAALSLSPAFVLQCVTKQSDAELLLEVATLAHELQHLVDSYGATAAQSATLSATWAHTLACTHAQPLLNAVRAGPPPVLHAAAVAPRGGVNAAGAARSRVAHLKRWC